MSLKTLYMTILLMSSSYVFADDKPWYMDDKISVSTIPLSILHSAYSTIQKNIPYDVDQLKNNLNAVYQGVWTDTALIHASRYKPYFEDVIYCMFISKLQYAHILKSFLGQMNFLKNPLSPFPEFVYSHRTRTGKLVLSKQCIKYIKSHKPAYSFFDKMTKLDFVMISSWYIVSFMLLVFNNDIMYDDGNIGILKRACLIIMDCLMAASCGLVPENNVFYSVVKSSWGDIPDFS